MLTQIEETSEIKIGFSEIEVFYGMTVSYPEELNLFKNKIDLTTLPLFVAR